MAGDITDQRALRNTLGAFATGVTVVTTRDANNDEWGFTANSFTSVSLDPPLVLFCLAKKAGSLAVFENAEHFAINILTDQQRDVSMLFASGDRDKFDKVAWRAARSGSPVLEDVSAWLDCVKHQVVDGGDHLIFIGRITDFGSRNLAPLGYCRGAYVPLALDHRMFQASGAATALSVGVIVEHDLSVLLRCDADTGQLRLPCAPNLGDADTSGSLLGRLARRGERQPALFVFAIFDDGTGRENVAVNNDVNTRRQRLQRCDGHADVERCIGQAKPGGTQRTGQNDRFAFNATEGFGRFRHCVSAMSDHDFIALAGGH